jgi:hypothetical protein
VKKINKKLLTMTTKSKNQKLSGGSTGKGSIMKEYKLPEIKGEN